MVKRFTFLGITVLVGGLAGCSSYEQVSSVPSPNSAPATPTTTQSAAVGSLSALEQAIHQQVNQYRISKGLPALELDARISEQSRLHSEAMAQGKVPFSHQGFEGRVKAVERAIPYRAAAENVAYNQGYQDPATQAVQGWIQSDGHRKNMEGDFDVSGIGVAQNARGEYYFTQVFIKRR
ncbi:CAP domain-containing protein [Oscillatoria salina]|uniref:CAP domain-containing protein n=1 Tax=Oscillatoria salina TaxID=331517 RepID=UPI0013B8BA4C|nr:CAP domain-containing protein [Oscillatoria salina]MBZ8179497.1 CAP domain-containing protein [Oscillatoria salina IIICB1]NET88521.1 CAP domain-containing protein [Kamptonema sp. SIO1D9]